MKKMKMHDALDLVIRLAEYAIETRLSRADDPKAHRAASAQYKRLEQARAVLTDDMAEIKEVVTYITRCAHIAGPHGTTMFFISREILDRARGIVGRVTP